MEAGRRGHRVLAVDASPTAVARLNKDAEGEGLPVRAIQADIENWTINESYDTIVAIGLPMFFRQETALKLLTEGFFDRNRGEAKSKELKSFSNDLNRVSSWVKLAAHPKKVL